VGVSNLPNIDVAIAVTPALRFYRGISHHNRLAGQDGVQEVPRLLRERLPLIADSLTYSWKAKNIEFATAIERGKEVADQNVVGALYRNAVGHYYEEEETHVVGNGPHAVLQTITVKKLHKPETAAQSLWLRNCRPAEWRN
jgi:hypothetical protein